MLDNSLYANVIISHLINASYYDGIANIKIYPAVLIFSVIKCLAYLCYKMGK